MGKSDFNKRSSRFRKDIKAYNNSVLATNRYNLKKIAGKLNIFEANDDEDDEEVVDDEETVDVVDVDVRRPKNKTIVYKKKEFTLPETYKVDRRIPNTDRTVLVSNDMFALGDADGEPMTPFIYVFVEGCLGDVNKVIRCITNDGDSEIVDARDMVVVEDAMGGPAVDGGANMVMPSAGFSTTDIGCCGKKDHSEIDYCDVEKQLMIPYLCGARIVDVNSGKSSLKKKRKKRKGKARR